MTPEEQEQLLAEIKGRQEGWSVWRPDELSEVNVLYDHYHEDVLRLLELVAQASGAGAGAGEDDRQ